MARVARTADPMVTEGTKDSKVGTTGLGWATNGGPMREPEGGKESDLARGPEVRQKGEEDTTDDERDAKMSKGGDIPVVNMPFSLKSSDHRGSERERFSRMEATQRGKAKER